MSFCLKVLEILSKCLLLCLVAIIVQLQLATGNDLKESYYVIMQAPIHLSGHSMLLIVVCLLSEDS